MKILPFQPKPLLSIVLAAIVAIAAVPVAALANDVTMPLHESRPDYPTPYGAPSVQDVQRVLERVHGYLDAVTPARAVDKNSGRDVTDFSQANDDTVFAPADFRLTSYEWGVTYAGMLQAAAATGDRRYMDYVTKRLALLGALAKPEAARLKAHPAMKSPVRTMLEPHALDDIGAVCAAMIKAGRAGYQGDLSPLLESCRKFITETEFRLPDGTLARNRPQPNTMWLDDLFMAVPALAQMGRLTGERKYFDDAVRQVRLYTERMFNPAVGLYQHGWVQAMDAKPQIRWARANGWAIMAKVELLDALPADHPGRPFVLQQLRAHAKGLVAYQHGSGFWHQLVDRNDSYLETSATAIYAYSLARAINQGYLDKLSFAPATMLAWNAVATKVNAKGQVEGTCVGTGMGFEPAYYYYRPVNVFAAHGYGPVLLAGAEIVTLLKNNQFEINDSAFQLAPAKK